MIEHPHHHAADDDDDDGRGDDHVRGEPDGRRLLEEFRHPALDEAYGVRHFASRTAER